MMSVPPDHMTPEQRQALSERIVARMLERDAFSRWLGVEVLTVAPGRAAIRMTVRAEMLNGFGVAHGGIVYALADSVLAFAANAEGEVALALNNTMYYPEKVVEGDVLTAVGEPVAGSARVGLYDVTVTRADGTTVGVFRGSVYRTRKPHF